MSINLNDYIAVYPDFPTKGISFKDIVPLLRDAKAFKYAINQLAKKAKKYKPTVICGPESRGFIFGVALAQKLGIGFVMARKPGKLPGKVISESYALEYGVETLEIQQGSFKKGDRVLFVDDLLATGGTIKAMKNLALKEGAEPLAALLIIKLIELNGEKQAELPCEYLLELSDSH